MTVHVRLKNEFTEDEKYDNLMNWLILKKSLHASVICFVTQLVKPMSLCDATFAAFLPRPKKYLHALFWTVFIF